MYKQQNNHPLLKQRYSHIIPIPKKWLENNKKHSIITRTFLKALWYAGKIPTKLLGFESRLLSPYIILEGKN